MPFAEEVISFFPAGTLESFRDDLGLTYAQAGTVLAMIPPGSLIGGAFTVAADHFSRRVIMAVGAVGLAVSMATFALGTSFPAMVVAAFLLGTAATALVDTSDIVMVELAGERLRPFLARSNLFGAIGDLAGPAVIASVVGLGFSWRAAFWVGALGLALYGLALALVPMPRPGSSATEGDGDDPRAPGGTRSTLGAVLRDPGVWMVGLLGILLGPFDEPFIGFAIALLEQDRGASTQVATVIAFVGVSGGLLSYTVLARRWEGVSDRLQLTAAALALAAGALIVAVAPNLVLIAGGAFIVSVGLNTGWLALQHRILTLRPGQVGTTQAVIGTIDFGGFWIPIAIGAIADHVGLAWALAASAGLGLALAGLAWGWSWKSRGGRTDTGALRE